MTRAFTADQVRARLTEYVAAHGRATTMQRLGVKRTHLYDMQRGTRNPSDKVLEVLGLTRAYVPAPTPHTESQP